MATHLPLISIILPTKNAERFLAEALESVVANGYPNYEIVIVDGHSSDRSAEIAGQFPNVRFLLQEGETGLPGGWNEALRAAHGDLIRIMGADDMLPKNALDRQVEYLRSHPEADYVVGRGHFFAQSGDEVASMVRSAQVNGDMAVRILETIMVRRRVFDQLGDFSTTNISASDVDWLARLKDSTAVRGDIDDIVILKRTHRDNLGLSRDYVAGINAGLLEALRASIHRQKSK